MVAVDSRSTKARAMKGMVDVASGSGIYKLCWRSRYVPARRCPCDTAACRRESGEGPSRCCAAHTRIHASEEVGWTDEQLNRCRLGRLPNLDGNDLPRFLACSVLRGADAALHTFIPTVRT